MIDPILEHLIEMKATLAEIKERSHATNEKIDGHIEWCASRDAKVDHLETSIAEMQGSIKTVKWAIPVVSAAVAGLMKIVGYLKS